MDPEFTKAALENLQTHNMEHTKSAIHSESEYLLEDDGIGFVSIDLPHLMGGDLDEKTMNRMMKRGADYEDPTTPSLYAMAAVHQAVLQNIGIIPMHDPNMGWNDNPVAFNSFSFKYDNAPTDFDGDQYKDMIQTEVTRILEDPDALVEFNQTVEQIYSGYDMPESHTSAQPTPEDAQFGQKGYHIPRTNNTFGAQ